MFGSPLPPRPIRKEGVRTYVNDVRPFVCRSVGASSQEQCVLCSIHRYPQPSRLPAIPLRSHRITVVTVEYIPCLYTMCFVHKLNACDIYVVLAAGARRLAFDDFTLCRRGYGD